MKIKSLTKLTLLAALLLGGAHAAWADPVYFGSSEKNLGPWADGVLVSPDYTVVKGSTTTVYYTNETNTTEETWQAYWNGMFEFNCGAYWITTRADNVSGETWQHADITPTITYSDNFGTMFTRDNMDGASVVLRVTRDADNNVEVLSTTTKGENTWWKKVTFVLPIDDNMVFRLRAEYCYGTISSVVSDKFVGPASNSTSWWNNFSDYYTIEADKTLTLNFKNYSSKTENWNNFVTVLTNDKDRGADGYAEQVVIRTDNYGWGTYYNSENFSNNYNWTTYKNDLDGANVELKIRRSGTRVAVKAIYTTTSGNKYYQQYVYTSPSATDVMRVFLTVDNSHVESLTSSVADTPDGAGEYSYTIKAVDGSDNDLRTFATGIYWTGEDAISVTYPMYILSGTSLHNIAANGSVPYFSKSFTPDAANYVGKLEYNNGTVSNVVYYTEAENVSGASAVDNNACSNGQFARWGTTAKSLTSLEAGIYKIYGKFYSGNTSTSNVVVKAGDTEVWNVSMATGTANSNEFTLTATTALTISCEGASTRGLDWVYIQKVGEPATIGTYGWATFSSDYALDFSKATTGLTAYMITGYEGNAVTLSDVTGTVPAGTGLLLKGAAGSYSVPVAESSSTDVSGNKLKAGTGAAVGYAEGYTRYVLSVSGGQAEFQRLAKDGASATVAKGKAYLEFTGTVSAPSLQFSFSDPTGISQIANGEWRMAHSVFDLLGRKVANPTKGLYIVNGKKVIIK